MVQLVARMTMAPGTCMLCGCGNTADEHGQVGPFIDLGMDYNWGDSGYLCMTCGSKIAAVVGWMTPEEKQSLEAVISGKDKKIHNLEAKMEILRRRAQEARNSLQRIREGSSELKRVRRGKVKA